ncbi:MAG: PAS domain S-box protein [Candidatus Hodarchaeales archaeon]|jgi:PAS domain S-box-containing protein
MNETITGEYFKHLEKSSSSSNKERKKSLRYFMKYLKKEDLSIKDVSTADLLNFMNFLSLGEHIENKKKKKGLSSTTIHQIFGLLKSFYKYSFENDLLETHPDLMFTDSLKNQMPKRETKPNSYFSRDEIHKLLKTAKNDKRALLYACYNSMASMPLVLDAKLSDLEFENKRLILKDKNNKLEIEAILRDEVIAQLQDYISKYRPISDSNYIFLSKYKKKLSTRTVQRYLKTLSLEILGRPITPRILREMSILHLQEEGSKIDEINLQRKIAEKALKESELRYSSLVETMTEGLLVIDTDGIIIYVNPAFLGMLDFTPEDLLGKSLDTFLLNNKFKIIFDKGQVIGRKGKIITYEQEWITKQGKKIWTIISPAFLYNDKDEVSGSFAILTDISERKRMEIKLDKRVKELDCLYSIARLTKDPDKTLEEVFNGIIALIISSWQYPDITCSRIVFEDKEFTSDNFVETRWKQTTVINVLKSNAGSVEVYYLEERSEEYEGPFLKEEKDLLKAIALEISKFITNKIIIVKSPLKI